MPEVTTFLGMNVPSGLLRVFNTKQSSAEWLWLRMELQSVAIERTCKASLHFAGSHNGNSFRVAHLQDGQNTGLRGLSEEYI